MSVAEAVPESERAATKDAPGSVEESPAAHALRRVAGVLAAALVLALADALIIEVFVPMPAGGLALRLADHAFDAAETLGVGALAAVAVGAFVRYARASSTVAFGVAGAATVAALWIAVGENVTRVTQHFVPTRLVPAVAFGYLVLLGISVPELYLVTERQLRARPRLRVPAAIGALLVASGGAAVLFDDYQGVHGVVAVIAALVGGAALAPAAEARLAPLVAHRRGKIGLALVSLVALSGIVIPPTNAVRFELFRQPCAVAPWLLATVLWRPPHLHGPVPPLPASPWSRDRSTDAPVPPTRPALLPAGPVVVLVTIDAVRGDAVLDPANAGLFPTFTELAREGVVFTRAMAPGSQTALSLSSVFSGRTFSEQLWTDHGEGRARFSYPGDDTSVRFPEILSAHGVGTFNAVGVVFLQNEFGVVRGFGEESVAVTGMEHAHARELIDRVVARLDRAAAGPLFLYTHLMDPHEPYDRGRTDGTDFERYLSEIAIADEHIGRVLRTLKARFPGRWVLVVSSDHGEAFGDHGTLEHAKSLYEELVHVPLFVAGAGVVPRAIDQRVSLVDLGPTILDLFGLETPATFLGQSLVPLLAGGHADLTRPLFAEGRLRRALETADGLKVIEDLRRKVVEVYDLQKDPGETRNLFDVEPARSDAALATLRAFFSAHTRTEGGYTPPFKP